MKKLFTVIAITIAVNSFSQQVSNFANGTKIEGEPVYSKVDSMPMFPGGYAAFGTYIQKNLHYKKPEGAAAPANPCLVNFIVEKDGSISNANVVRGAANAPDFDKECLRVISTMPKWTPGKDKGKPVRVSFNLPVKYAEDK